jgi:hypothetical protein
MDTYEQDESVEDYDCPVCQGRGCTICGMSGEIQVRVSGAQLRQQQNVIVPPKIVVNATDYEKDQLMTQMGRLRLISTVSQKEYSAALTVFKEIKDLSERMEQYIPEKMYDIVKMLKEDQITELKPIENALELLHELQQTNAQLFDRINRLSLHFEMSLETLNRTAKEIVEQRDDDKNELDKFRKLIMSSAQRANAFAFQAPTKQGRPPVIKEEVREGPELPDGVTSEDDEEDGGGF